MKKLNIVIWRENVCASKNTDFHQPTEFFFSKKISQMKADQNYKYDITKILGFVQVCSFLHFKKQQIFLWTSVTFFQKSPQFGIPNIDTP